MRQGDDVQLVDAHHDRSAREAWPYAVVGCVAYAGLVAYVMTRNRGLFWDEIYHAAWAKELAGAPSFRSWLLNDRVVATGPGYALMNFALSGGRGALAIPWARVPNLVLVGTTAALTGCCLKLCRLPVCAVFGIMAIPMIWVVHGLAITEPLALAGFCLAAIGAFGKDEESDRRRSRWLWIVLGVAISTSTRQTYLLAIPGLLIAASSDRRSLVMAISAVAIGLTPLAALIGTWHGLTPPRMAFMGAGGFSLSHGFLALAITGTAAAILAPRFYIVHRWTSFGFGVAAVVLNEIFHFVRPTTLSSVQKFFENPVFGAVAERLIGIGIVAAGAAFGAAAIGSLWRETDRNIRGAVVIVLGMCLAAAGVTHLFSSRYAVMAIPALILMLARSMDFGNWGSARIAAGSLLGLAVLHSYYTFA